MNNPIRRLGVVGMVLILALLVNLTYVQVVEAPGLRDDPRNPRLLIAEYSNPRGQISADGRLLASSVATSDALKYQRKYPNGAEYAPVTGYFSRIYGETGLERSTDAILNGSDGRLLFHRVADLISGRSPTPGNVVTTIDPHMQDVAYQDMTRKGYAGAVVAIQPSTGAILAMVSTPSFDPGPLASHDAATQQKAMTEQTTAQPQTLLNRAISQTYPPGSTFKLVDLTAALQDGFTPDTPVTAEPRITLPGTSTTLENYDGEHCGPGAGTTVPLSEALARSCNTAFATVTDQVGAAKLRSAARAYGIDGPELDIPTPVVGSHLGALADEASLAQSGIGQRDVRLTPLQNAEIVATIANGGERMAPYLVKEIDGPDLSVIDTTQPDDLGRALPAGIADQIRTMMLGSEQFTTGHGALPGVTIASKTGTAEHGINSKTTPPHTWYSAFAPADAPVVAVSVIVENGGHLGDAGTGGSVASPIGRDVIAAAIEDGVTG